MWKFISLTTFFVLVNRSPKEYFGCSRGLHQGDPLSLLLFLLVARILSGMLTRAAKVGMIAGFRIGWDDLIMSHFQYADNTIIFCDNSHRHIKLLRRILWCFEAVSGLNFNLTNSSLILVGEVVNLDQLVADLRCCMGQLPTLYLRLP